MKDIRESILENRFPEFVRSFMHRYYAEKPIPEWIQTALKRVNIEL